MYSTGSSYFNAFLHVAVYSPVIPLLIIIFRQLYYNQSFNLLMIYCLMSIFFSMFGDLVREDGNLGLVFMNMQYLVEFILLSLLVRSAMNDSTLKQIVNIIMAIFCTIVITYAVIRGYDNHLPLMYGTGNALLLFISLLLSFELIRTEKKNLSTSYRFWIVAAIFFCYGFNFLVSFGWKFFFTRNTITAQELWSFSYLASFLKNVFFSTSTLVYKRQS